MENYHKNMANQIYLQLALPTPLRRLFDYLPPQGIDKKHLIPGIRVKVPFQKRHLIGILMAIVEETLVPESKLKSAIEVIDDLPIFPPDVYQLCEWAAQYYHYALGEVFASALPGLLRKGKNIPIEKMATNVPAAQSVPLKLNVEQQQAIEKISENLNDFHPILLEGITGSGKTEVYLQVIHDVLKQNKQVLVLLPEISLTPQTIARFQQRFPKVGTFHSGLSENERAQTWVKVRQGHINIIIGTRSAVFIPFKHLGLIIVDEEHDASYKQQDRFRYHARDLAVMRAQINKIPVILGSATPSLETLLNVSKKRYQHTFLSQRAGNAVLPQYQVIDLQQSPVEEGFSQPLLNRMEKHLAENNQVMLFLNRRGFAPVLYCSHCAWTARCKRCDVNMVYHQKPLRLHCHHCDVQSKMTSVCPSCRHTKLQPIGLGTQRLEEFLSVKFPNIPIIRVDRDNTRRKNAMQKLLTQVAQEPKAILLGTQMLAKGHHFPNVTLVGVIDADVGLFSADFRGTEQMGQLLLQIAGRAGREEKLGTVVIQTRNPQHPLLNMLLNDGYQTFAHHLLTERKQAILPPFSYFALFRAEAYAVEKANAFLEAIKQMSLSFDSSMSLMGPVSALIAKKKNLYCQQLLIKADKRIILQRLLHKILLYIEQIPEVKSVKWILDVDPVTVI
jgi:primosomal protein N' (replication factor Y) (superfamily II helicase)